MIPLMVMADSRGQLFEHPDLQMVGALGSEAVAPELDELSPLPEGSRFFTMPGHLPVGGDPEADELVTVDEADWGDGPETPQAACTFPAPGWMRTLLPFAERIDGAETLPLWAYTAMGLDPDTGEFVCAAVQVDDCPRWAPEEYDDRGLSDRLAEMKGKFPKNRMIAHLDRCASEFHCFAAKNFFAGRWEMGLPIAPLCNADCRGCISLQTDELFPASHERIEFVPSPEELAEIACAHLEGAEKAVASFGQGCEGEPLLQAAVIERACRLIRQKTDRGTLHLNTNGSRPEWLPRLAEAGLDSVRISTNSFIPGRHHAYYRPETYSFEEMEDSVRTAAGAGLYTQLNYLVFPGVTDREAEVEALLDFCGRTGVHVLQMKNLCIDPELYLDTLDEEEGETGEAVGMTRLLGILEEEAPEVALRYFNRPRDEWHLDPGASPASSPPPSAPPPAGEKG